MNGSRRNTVLLYTFVVLAACADEASPDRTSPNVDSRIEPQSIADTQAAAVTMSSASEWKILFPDDLGDEQRIAGYSHAPEKSRFARGEGEVRLEERSTARKETSSNGVFAQMLNGFSLGVPDADAQSWNPGPFSSDADAHTERVVSYFLESGLPKEQMGGTTINTWIAQGGPTTITTPDGQRIAAQVNEQRVFLGYVSKLERQVAGVSVEDSFAWALLNAKSEAVWEEVWWPELRGTLLTDIERFKERTHDSEWLAGLGQRGDGHLAIHHATPMGEKWYSVVTYDVVGGPEVVHFDVDGRRLMLSAWEDAKGGAR